MFAGNIKCQTHPPDLLLGLYWVINYRHCCCCCCSTVISFTLAILSHCAINKILANNNARKQSIDTSICIFIYQYAYTHMHTYIDVCYRLFKICATAFYQSDSPHTHTVEHLATALSSVLYFLHNFIEQQQQKQQTLQQTQHWLIKVHLRTHKQLMYTQTFDKHFLDLFTHIALHLVAIKVYQLHCGIAMRGRERKGGGGRLLTWLTLSQLICEKASIDAITTAAESVGHSVSGQRRHWHTDDNDGDGDEKSNLSKMVNGSPRPVRTCVCKCECGSLFVCATHWTKERTKTRRTEQQKKIKCWAGRTNRTARRDATWNDVDVAVAVAGAVSARKQE